MDGSGGCFGAHADELMERDHELRASLCGIEAAAVALSEQRDRLSSLDVDQLALAIASEARRLRAVLASEVQAPMVFDLTEAIRPAIVVARSAGLLVRDAVPTGISVHGSRNDVTQVVFGLLDNARIHAAPSPVDVRVVSDPETTTLYIEDRGPGVAALGAGSKFERGRRGVQSPGSGLGLFIARRLMVEQGGSLSCFARPGGGTSFALTLPTSSQGVAAAQMRAARRLAIVR